MRCKADFDAIAPAAHLSTEKYICTAGPTVGPELRATSSNPQSRPMMSQLDQPCRAIIREIVLRR